MIITVMFRDVFSKVFKTGPYTYKCDFKEIQPGDIVIVETKWGISLAQVEKINQKLLNAADLMSLKNVLEICKTKYEVKNV